MNKQQKLILVLILFTAVNFIMVFQTHAQVKKIYSGATDERGSAIRFLEVRVIETDPVLKIAKETVPFDRAFFLKIKRQTKSKKVGTLTIKTDSSITFPIDSISKKTNTTKTESYSKELKETLPNQKIENDGSKISSIKLKSRNYIKDIDVDIYPNGRLYQEDVNSEFFYIEIQDLAPNTGYILALDWEGGSNEDEEYTFTTVASTLDKRLKQRIVPQLGVAGALFKDNKEMFIKPSLVLGFYYQPWAIDPDIPISYYKLHAKQRFSGFVGLTINSISTDDQRRDDLLGDNNILIGIGYQVKEAIRFSYGGIIFYEVSPNRLISDRKSFASTSYFAVSFDIKLKDILGGIVTTLGFK